MKTLAVLTTSNTGHYGKLNDTYKHLDPFKPGGGAFTPVRGVNVMLGGVMLSAIILVIFVLCYCCHKTNRKTPTTANQTQSSTYWRDPGLSMEIYTVDTQNCMEYEEFSTDSRRSSLQGPPPPYELVVGIENNVKLTQPPTPPSQLPENHLEPPSYEKACQLQEFQITATGYV